MKLGFIEGVIEQVDLVESPSVESRAVRLPSEGKGLVVGSDRKAWRGQAAFVLAVQIEEESISVEAREDMHPGDAVRGVGARGLEAQRVAGARLVDAQEYVAVRGETELEAVARPLEGFLYQVLGACDVRADPGRDTERTGQIEGRSVGGVDARRDAVEMEAAAEHTRDPCRCGYRCSEVTVVRFGRSIEDGRAATR